ncbi:major capsid protein [Paenarthrobacter sp. YJN-5]|uniref:major capsid protein n=1 Tax=Paenarthrobacter sp. YJN-5 TaxID=2735316 RepID=UPI001877FCE2|nr:major capsid protein [Paenarthrobacter sp. YJN-5]QOT19728.1 major capsid protein E [Paenarthrobacter sp. YJN-5]
MALWTDLITPAELTGYARASLEDFEARNGTLARWLPNRFVQDIVARFVAGAAGGLIAAADYRAYDAEPTLGKGDSVKRYTIDLPAVGRNIPISEYQQLRNRNSSDAAMIAAIERTVDIVVRAVVNRVEAVRGTVLVTGKATVSTGAFSVEDDYGRAAGHTLTAGSLWSTGSVDRLAYLQTINDVYRDANGEDAGVMLMSTRVFRALASGDQFQTQLLNGGARNATRDEVLGVVSAAGNPDIVLYDRSYLEGSTKTKVIPDDRILLLPEPVDPNDGEGSQLGATFWGQTLTSMSEEYGLADTDLPGLVVGVHRNEKPPMIAEVVSDAIAWPVLANPNLSLAAKVL